jgi:putative membrane protein
LQTLLTGLWAVYLLRGAQAQVLRYPAQVRVRLWVSLFVLILWAANVIVLISDWTPGRYLALILAWALLPVILQVAFGADLLLSNWKRVIMIVLFPTLYLWWVDALAIASGTWTIDPRQITGFKWGVLPLEEMLFFLMTNLIIAFGMTLMLSPDSPGRLRRWWLVISNLWVKRSTRIPQTAEPGTEPANLAPRIRAGQLHPKLNHPREPR